MVQYISTVATFKKTIADAKEQGKAVVIDYTVAWCGPCTVVSPVFEDLQKEHDPDVLFFKVDIEGNEALDEANSIIEADQGKPSEGTTLAKNAKIIATPTFHGYNFEREQLLEEIQGGLPGLLRKFVIRTKNGEKPLTEDPLKDTRPTHKPAPL